MNELIESTFLKETIEFKGAISELKEQIRLKKGRNFNLEWISDKEFKVISKVSIGIIMLNNFPGFFDGIKGYGTLTELNNGNTQIHLTTKLRVEMYFIGILSAIFFLVAIFSNEKFPIWLFFLFPIMLVWFWFVYRFQEKRLFQKVRNYIKIELKNAVQQRL